MKIRDCNCILGKFGAGAIKHLEDSIRRNTYETK